MIKIIFIPLLFLSLVSCAFYKNESPKKKFFIIDKKESFIIYTENEELQGFEVIIICNYYKDTEIPEDDPYAEIELAYYKGGIESRFNREPCYDCLKVLNIKKRTLNQLDTINAQWVSEQKSRLNLSKKISLISLKRDESYYVLFREDLDDTNKTVKAYQVGFGLREIEF